ncbi:hypothetical protein C8F04DRAFT_1082136 [Mycena alexandri]|uniref:Uncharacterized protein n=1 Tax=Mycena alexandri TaxID=1745969 RepID=A0AAD6T6L3_9AGAR|nr:hypothetical protein C8F04DRAFT_1082136 [Mycena alexandri]
MGIPYSRQINAAFDQVTPLVAEGFKVLQATRNISILLAVIQVLTVILLLQILVLLLAILITVHPNLEHERDALVTPALRWGASWLIWISHSNGGASGLVVIGVVVVIAILMGGAGGLWATGKNITDVVPEEEDAEEVEGREEGKDGDASKDGKSKDGKSKK